jgi:L-alanine-DL-glutamate epimerase-like enolase superfamily enzyme
MAIAAGEYAWDVFAFRHLLEAGAVDVLQADATRCGGVTGFLRANALCDSWNVPLSAHTAPQLHAHLCCSASRAAHVEYFHDHARIEAMLFDGALAPDGGLLRPDPSRPGLGVAPRLRELERYEVAI